jgi:hypothetical protein
MITEISIRTTSIDTGDELWNRLQLVSPSLFDGKQLRYGYWPETHREVIAFRSLLKEEGFREARIKPDWQDKRTIVVYRRRVFSHEEIASAPFAKIRPNNFQPVSDPAGVETDIRAFKSVRKLVAPLFADDDFGTRGKRLWLTKDLAATLKVHDWKHVRVLPAHRNDPHASDGYSPWDGAIEVSSDLTLPAVAHGPWKYKCDGTSTLTQEPVKSITGMYDEGFHDLVPKFYLHELAPLGDWDVAISYEEVMGAHNRYVFVSQRVYKTFRALNLDHLCDWKPCEIIDGERPSSA